jgi:hypothetical protein
LKWLWKRITVNKFLLPSQHTLAAIWQNQNKTCQHGQSLTQDFTTTATKFDDKVLAPKFFLRSARISSCNCKRFNEFLCSEIFRYAQKERLRHHISMSQPPAPFWLLMCKVAHFSRSQVTGKYSFLGSRFSASYYNIYK